MAARLIVALFFICKSFAIVRGIEIGDGCTYGENTPGICKLIYQCQQVITDISENKPYVDCKPGTSPVTVCCPDPNAPKSRTTPGHLSELRCKEYSEYAYENVTDPASLPGEQPSIVRDSQCPFDVVPLIVGGEKALAKEFPHMARLGYGPDNNIKYSCGGSVISRRYILTAAHCAQSRKLGIPKLVRIGDLVFDQDNDDARPVTIKVVHVTVHPDYSPFLQYHDIALLRLAENIVFNKYVRPACLNTVRQYSQTKAIATGWGSTGWYAESSKPLLKVILDLFTFSECSPKYAANHKTPQGLNENQQFCAGSRDYIKDTCEGDSGGPLQVYHEFHCMYRIIGVTSFGKACGITRTPAVYTRVSNYIDWIESIAFSDG